MTHNNEQEHTQEVEKLREEFGEYLRNICESKEEGGHACTAILGNKCSWCGNESKGRRKRLAYSSFRADICCRNFRQTTQNNK